MHALLSNALYLPFTKKGERDCDAMREDTLWNSTEIITGSYSVPDLLDWCEFPFPIRKRCKVNAPVQEEAALLRQIRKRILQTIEYLRKEPRAKLYGEKLSCEFNLIAYLYATGHLIDLHGCNTVGYPDYLALEPCAAHADVTDLILDDAIAEADVNHVSIDTGNVADCACCHIHSLSENLRFYLFVESAELRLSLFLRESLRPFHQLQLQGIDHQSLRAERRTARA